MTVPPAVTWNVDARRNLRCGRRDPDAGRRAAFKYAFALSRADRLTSARRLSCLLNP